MQVKISDIKIKKRIREDIGDLNPLIESLESHGQFHPITLNDNLELISGFRRLQSAKKLGWETIEAEVIGNPDKEELLKRELEENLVRKDFTDNELQDAYLRLKKLQNPNLFTRICRQIKQFFNSIVKKIKKS